MDGELKGEKNPILVPVIVGPTASGKTKLAVHLADQFSEIEIISADSRQIYRGMDIGTAKPSETILQQIPHHLIDIHTPDHRFSAGQFSRDASSAIASIVDRGKIPLVVGGTGFYVQALFEGLSAPAADTEIYASLEGRLITEGYESLFNELLRIDPEATKLYPQENQVKTLRALTCWYQTGVKYSTYHHQALQSQLVIPHYCLIFPERDQLYQRINNRVVEMFDEGLVEETRALLASGYSSTTPGLRTVGYKEVIDMLEGEITVREVIPAVQQSTRRYAKRQYTWFRNKIEGATTIESVSQGRVWFKEWVLKRGA